jgi:hypothetical protein
VAATTHTPAAPPLIFTTRRLPFFELMHPPV